MVLAVRVNQVFDSSVASSCKSFNLFWSVDERSTVMAYPIVELVVELLVSV